MITGLGCSKVLGEKKTLSFNKHEVSTNPRSFSRSFSSRPICAFKVACYKIWSCLVDSQAVSSSGSVQHGSEKLDGQPDESKIRLAQLQHQLPYSEPGALMHLVEDAEGLDDDDEETKECKSLFKNMKFFLSREVRLVV
ncbi:hypothetical protein Nepgr_008618 [Nepenthes gracilis]|uniref:Uncharacterized protein n=1 Tax=Nepenthes gracilis TaxID=150966 RepID=A0AAD3XJF4_NEPGR|nr:hypothetical protein Nepgr_008618 [Nepenthes gracilis]